MSSINLQIKALQNDYKAMTSDIKSGIATRGQSTSREAQDKRIDELSKKIIELKSNLETGDPSKLDKKFIASEKKDLNRLEKNVDQLKLRLGEIPVKFQAENRSNKNFIAKAYESIVEGFVNACNTKVRSYCFMGAFKSKANQALPKKIAHERAKLAEVEGKLAAARSKINDLKSQIDDGLPISQLKKTNALLSINTQKKDTLKKEREVLKTRIDKWQNIVDSEAAYDNKGDEARKCFSVLGGSRVEMTTADNVKLDGFYLDAKAFRNTLKDSGCELTTFKFQTDQKELPERQVQALSMSAADYAAKGKNVMKALEQLKGLSGDPTADNPVLGAGWSEVRDGSNILLVRSEELPKHDVNDHALFKFDKHNKVWLLKHDSASSKARQKETLDVDSPAKGTVIFSSGATGIYEMHKDEALGFLFKNMNVVLFNFRGYGKSEGEPTEKGLKLDMEAAYQLAKAKSGHEDKQILFKALCMSGGPAAYVAAKHPETNLFLDQTYSDFRNYVFEATKSHVEHTLGVDEPDTQSVLNLIRTGIADIAGRVVAQMTPDFNTAKALAANSGHKAIFFTVDDTTMDMSQVQRNMESVSKAGKMEFLSVFPAPGEHGDDLFAIKSSVANENISEKLKEIAKIYAAKDKARAELVVQKNSAKKKLAEIELEIKAAQAAGEEPKVDEKTAVRKGIYKDLSALRTAIKEADKEIRLLGIEYEEEKDYMRAIHGPNAAKKEMVGRNQLSHFLAKADLADDILKSDTILRQSIDSPLVRTQRDANRYINTLERLKTHYQTSERLPEGEGQLLLQAGKLVLGITNKTANSQVMIDLNQLPERIKMAEEILEFLSIKHELERGQLGKQPSQQNSIADLMVQEEEESKNMPADKKLNPEATAMISDIRREAKVIEQAFGKFYKQCDDIYTQSEGTGTKLGKQSIKLVETLEKSVDGYNLKKSKRTFEHVETMHNTLEEIKTCNLNLKVQVHALSETLRSALLVTVSDPRSTVDEKNEISKELEDWFGNLIKNLTTKYEAAESAIEQTLSLLPPDVAAKILASRE